MKFSLFRLIVCLPLVVALLLTIYICRKSAIHDKFTSGVDNDQITLNYSELVGAFGLKKAISIVETNAATNDKLFTDGVNRIVQIVKQREMGVEKYIVALRTFEGESGNWIGPSGMRVNSIEFTDNEVLVDVFGELRWKSSSVFIPESEKATFSIPWSVKEKPSHGNLSPNIRMWAINSGKEVED